MCRYIDDWQVSSDACVFSLEVGDLCIERSGLGIRSDYGNDTSRRPRVKLQCEAVMKQRQHNSHFEILEEDVIAPCLTFVAVLLTCGLQGAILD